MLLIPHLLCLLGLLALDTVQAAAAPAAVKLQRGTCPEFWHSFNGHCYKYVATHQSWADAETNCIAQDAHLVSIHSREEDNFVRMLINNFDVKQVAAWVGMTDAYKEGSWVWTDGSKASYSKWQHGEPNNLGGQHCAVTNCGTDWCCGQEWCDGECSRPFPSVCKITS